MNVPYISVQDHETVTASDVPKAALHSGTEPPEYQEAINIESIQPPNAELPPPSYNSSTVEDASNVN